MPGISHLPQRTSSKERERTLRKGNVVLGVRMASNKVEVACHLAHSAQQEASAKVRQRDQQIMLLNPDVAEDSHGSSLEVPQMKRDCLLKLGSAATETSIRRNVAGLQHRSVLTSILGLNLLSVFAILSLTFSYLESSFWHVSCGPVFLWCMPCVWIIWAFALFLFMLRYVQWFTVCCASSRACLPRWEWWAWEWETGVCEMCGSLLYLTLFPPLSWPFCVELYFMTKEWNGGGWAEKTQKGRGRSMRKQQISLFVLLKHQLFCHSNTEHRDMNVLLYFTVFTSKGCNKKYTTRDLLRSCARIKGLSLSASWIIKLNSDVSDYIEGYYILICSNHVWQAVTLSLTLTVL